MVSWSLFTATTLRAARARKARCGGEEEEGEEKAVRELSQSLRQRFSRTRRLAKFPLGRAMRKAVLEVTAKRQEESGALARRPRRKLGPRALCPPTAAVFRHPLPPHF